MACLRVIGNELSCSCCILRPIPCPDLVLLHELGIAAGANACTIVNEETSSLQTLKKMRMAQNYDTMHVSLLT
jgi:hypothetical protein